MLSRGSEIDRLDDYLNVVEEITETMGGSAIESTSCSSHKNSFLPGTLNLIKSRK